MSDLNKFWLFTPQKDISAAEVAEVLRAMRISLRDDLVMTYMLKHFTEIQPITITVDGEANGT
jgi:hypothetical protein